MGKLTIALQQWNVMDKSALILLQPWKSVLQTEQWDRLMLRAIMPKLVEALRQFTIDPTKYVSFESTAYVFIVLPFRSQSLTLFKAVTNWVDHFPPGHMAAMFEVEFFPKWLQILKYWLSSPNPSFQEISQWYLFWKQQFPSVLLNQEPVMYDSRLHRFHLSKC